MSTRRSPPPAKHTRPRPLVLIILDGWGVRHAREKNAIALARTPTFDWLDKHASTAVAKTILRASGEAVGLPAGYQGNSEVGHITIGAGRVIEQMMSRIDDAIADGSFYRNKALLSAVSNCKRYGSSLHIMGLVQDEGVHAMTRHAVALLELARRGGVKNVWLHIFTDGRDTPPRSAEKYVTALLKEARRIEKAGGRGNGKRMNDASRGLTIQPATMIGRYYAMDRDKRWDRTQKAFDLIVSAKGKTEKDPLSAIRSAYRDGENDEFITPRVFPAYAAHGGMREHDSVLFFNYRLDRARQLTHAITDKGFTPFKRRGSAIEKDGESPRVRMAAMTPYYREMECPAAFDIEQVRNNLGETLSKAGLRQLRCAETEKYAHVTYFLNSEQEKPFKGERRILIPSPKVATYDLKPEMSAHGITAEVLKAIHGRKEDVIIVNFANGDMVGHTGDLGATIKAVETVDLCVGRILQSAGWHGGVTIITADHGNCEEKVGATRTSHTTNPVPFYLIGMKHADRIHLAHGGLADVAPTALKLLGIKKPKEMTGNSLF